KFYQPLSPKEKIDALNSLPKTWHPTEDFWASDSIDGAEEKLIDSLKAYIGFLFEGRYKIKDPLLCQFVKDILLYSDVVKNHNALIQRISALFSTCNVELPEKMKTEIKSALEASILVSKYLEIVEILRQEIHIYFSK